ncbi:MAG: TrkA C-terminal domain-containing protein, partial [Halobacteria archaeon]|nr:TrkA C-terminal domain-containing protein [Halobacteria archaeon]
IGVNAIENPQRLIAEYLLRAVQRPSVKDFMRLAGGAEVFEITVVEGSPMENMTLIEADNRGIVGDDARVIAIERNGNTMIPRGDTEIQAGDLVSILSLKGVTKDIMHSFTGD